MQPKGQAINKFTIGEKEVEGKNARFTYDRGNYTIIEMISAEEQNVIYKSRNSQEAYYKWNVYIGRKKERASRPTDANKHTENK